MNPIGINSAGEFQEFTISSGGVSKTTLTNQTLSSGSWTLSGSYYIYTFSNANIVATSYVSVTPQNASVSIVKTAQILPYVLCATGTVTFYSTNAPMGDIIVDVTIFN